MVNKIVFAAVVGVLIFSGVLFLIPLVFTVLIAFLKLDSLKSYLGHFIVDYKLFSTFISILLVGSFLLTIKNSKKASNDWVAFLLWCFAWISIGIIFHFARNADFFPAKLAYYAPIKSPEELIAEKTAFYNSTLSGFQPRNELKPFSANLCTHVEMLLSEEFKGSTEKDSNANQSWLELRSVTLGYLSAFKCSNNLVSKYLFFSGIGSKVSKVDCKNELITLVVADQSGVFTNSQIDLASCTKIVK